MRLARHDWAWAAGLALFVLATNRWIDNGPWGGDVLNYERIARAAPGLPDGDQMLSVFGERFGFHWLVGGLADLTGLSVRTIYPIVSVALFALAILVAVRLFQALELRRWIYVVGLAAFVLAAYSELRGILQAPGAVQDLAFVLGVALLLLGLAKVNAPLVVTGVVVGLVGRQSMLPAALAGALWILFDPAWRARATNKRAAIAATAAVIAAALYFALQAIARSFTTPGAPDTISETILAAPGTPRELALHLLRCAIAVAVVAPPLLAVLALLRLRGLPPRLWLCLLMFAAIIVQPLIVSPDFPGFVSNEQRLSGFALLPLCAALAIALQEAAERGVIADPSRRTLVVIVGLLGLASLHHVLTWIGPGSLAQFLALQAIAGLGVAAAILSLARAGRAVPPGAVP